MYSTNLKLGQPIRILMEDWALMSITRWIMPLLHASIKQFEFQQFPFLIKALFKSVSLFSLFPQWNFIREGSTVISFLREHAATIQEQSTDKLVFSSSRLT